MKTCKKCKWFAVFPQEPDFGVCTVRFPESLTKSLRDYTNGPTWPVVVRLDDDCAEYCSHYKKK